jgi:hypothetical protein
MYDNGTLTKYKFERALTYCNNPGSAFVISAVGVSLFGSKRLGTVLYICLLLSAVTVGALSGLLIKSDDRQKLASAIPPKNNLALGNTGIRIFTSALQNSAFAMLAVCAYVTFFSSFTGCIGALAKYFDASENILAALFGFLGRRAETPVRALWWIVLVACLCTALFSMLDNLITILWYQYAPKAARAYILASL